MFLKKRVGKRKISRVWKPLFIAAMLLCACAGEMWGATGEVYYRWEGTLTNGQPVIKKYSGDKSRLESLKDTTDTEWVDVDWTVHDNIISHIEDDRDNGNLVFIFPKYDNPTHRDVYPYAENPSYNPANDPKIGDFTVPQNVELSFYVFQPVVITGNLEIYGSAASHGELKFATGSSVTVKSGGSFLMDDGQGSVTSVGDIIIERDAVFENRSGTLQTDGTIVNNGTIINSGTLTNNGVIENNGDFTTTGTATNNGSITGNTVVGTVTQATTKKYYWVGKTSGSFLWNDPANWGTSDALNATGGKGIPRQNDEAYLRTKNQDDSLSITFTDNVTVKLIDAYRPASDTVTTNYTKINTYTFSGKVITNKLDIHSGANVTLEGNGNLIDEIVTHEDTEPSASLTITSNTKCSTSVVVANNSKLTISSGGKLETPSLIGSTSSFEDSNHNTTKAVITNEGEIDVDTSITALSITNNGTITGNASTISVSSITGTGDISVTSGTITLTSTTAESELGNLTIGAGGSLTAANNVTVNGDFTVTGSGNVNVAIGEGKSLLFKGAVTGETGSSVELAFGLATDIGKDKTVTFEKDISGLGNFKSYYKTVFAGCESVAADKYIELKNSVTLNNPLTLTANTGGRITIDKTLIGTATNKLTVNSKGSEIKFGEANEFSELVINGSDSSVKVQFAANEIQKITKGTFKGASTTDKLTLISTGSDKWKICTSASSLSFENVAVENSESVDASTPVKPNPLNLTQSATTISDTFDGNDESTTLYWFKYPYCWKGTEDSKWTNKSNWAILDASNNPHSIDAAPAKNDTTADIIIQNDTNTLTLNADDANPIDVNSITVDSGATVDFAGCNVNTNDATNGIINNGTIRLTGTGTITGTMQNGSKVGGNDESTIEYYGTFSAMPWDGDGDDSDDVKSYDKLVFAAGASGGNLTDKLYVAKTTEIYSTNSISLKGEFTGNIELNDTLTSFALDLDADATIAGTAPASPASPIEVTTFTITSDSDKTLTITTAEKLSVNKLNVGESSKPVKLTAPAIEVANTSSINGTVTTTGNQKYTEKVTLIGNSTFTTANSTFTGGFDGTDSNDITIAGNAKIYGDNTFNNFTCTTAGATLKFEGGKTQTVNGVITLTGATGTGNLITLDSIDGSTQWKIEVPAANIDKDHVKITYVKVYDSEAVNSFASLNLGDDSATGNNCKKGGNTKKWFLKNTYTWIGGATETTWDKDSNWKDEDGDYSVPPKNISSVAIVIDGEGTLTLASTDVISVKSITVNAGKNVDFKGRPITTAEDITNNGTINFGGGTVKTTSGSITNNSTINFGGGTITIAKGITNNGTIDFGGGTITTTDGITNDKSTIRLIGTETITGTMKNVNDIGASIYSTIVYYGDCSAMPWDGDNGIAGKQYGNLEFEKGATGTVTETIIVENATTIKSDNTNSIDVKLTNEDNKFKNTVTINSGSPSLNGTFYGVEIGGGKDISLSGKFDSTYNTVELAAVAITSLALELKTDVTFVGASGSSMNKLTAKTSSSVSPNKELTVNGVLDVYNTTPNKITLTNCDLTNNGTITSRGNFSITGDLKNTGTGTLNGNATDTISVTGDVTDEGTWGYKGTINFNGSTDQTFTNKVTTTYPKVTASNNLTVDNDFNVTTLKIESGKTVTTSKKFVLGSDSENGTITGDTSTTGGILTLAGTTATTPDTDATIYGTVDITSLENAGTTSVSGTIKTSGDQEYTDKVTLIGDSTFEVTDTAKTSTFTAGFEGTVSNNVAIKGNTVIKGDNTFGNLTITKGNATFDGANTFDNIKVDNSESTALTSVKFREGKLQTIKDCKFSGNINNQLTLTTITTPTLTPPATDYNSNDLWLVYFEKFDPSVPDPDIPEAPEYDTTNSRYNPYLPKNFVKNFDYVVVEYSKSVKDDATRTAYPLKMPQSFSHACETDLNTYDWFRYVFYWVGGTDPVDGAKWTEKANWRYELTEETEVLMYPPIVGHRSEIFVATRDSKQILRLGDSVAGATTLELKTLDITIDKILDIGKCSLDIKEEFFNRGTIRLDGTQTNPITVNSSGKNEHANTSTIEYYGGTTSSKLDHLYLFASEDSGVKKFKNLKFAKDERADKSGGTLTTITTYPNVDTSDKIEVEGKTIIKAETGNTIALTNTANKFTAEVIIGDDTAGSEINGGVVTLGAGSAITFAPVIYSDSITLNSTNVIDAKNTTDSNLTIKSKLIIEGKINFAGDTNSKGSVLIFDDIETKDSATLTFAVDVLATSATSDVTFGGGTNAITFGKNLIIDYPFDQPSGTVASLTFTSPITTSGNFVLYNGTVVANKNLTVTGGDIILLGSDYKITDPKTNKTNFVYNQYRGTSSAPIARNYTATKLPDGVTDVPSLATEFVSLPSPANVVPFHGKFIAGNGVTIKAGKNFYANGIELSGSASWNLSVAKNSDASSFAEAHYCTVENSNAICNDGATDGSSAKVNAYECNLADLTKNDTNTNWDFEDFTITSANSISDSIVKVTFSSPVRILSTTSNELYSTNHSVKYSKAAYDFTNVYADSTNENVAYFKVNDTKKDNWWKTDATGTDGGKRDSTDSLGNAHNNQANGKPVTTDLCFARITPGLTTDFTDAKNIAVLTTKWGKRINNYVEDPTTPATKLYYDGTTDGASPVLIYVYTGQETHKYYAGTPESQPSYDAHNFIEFVYSEPVELYNADEVTVESAAYDSANPNEPNIFENAKATNTLGKIENSGNGILISGVAKIDAGRLQTGTGGTADGTVNAFYRKSGMNAHTLRISIAGYTDGTITDNDGNEYKKWIGYIDSSATPSGAVTMPAGNCPQVKDLAENICNLVKPGLAITSPANPTLNDYGEWDVKKPSFAVYRRAKKAWAKDALPESEAVGSTIDGTSSLKRIEFHLFDNEPKYNASEPYQWVSRQGWVLPFTPSPDIVPDLYREYSYAADIFGGSRPFVASPDVADSARTAGGIRYSSVAESAAAFKYIEESANATPNKAFDSSVKAFAGAGSPVFQSITSPSRNASGVDGLYFGLNFADTILSLRTHFLISYDSSAGYITDLAGNRLGNGTETITIRTKDLTPPSFNLTVAPVGQNKLYVMFNKTLNINNVSLLDENDNKIVRVALTEAYPNAFGLYELSADNNLPVEADITIDKNVPAKVLYQNEDYMGLEFTLTRDVTFADIRKLYLVAKPEGKNYKDPVIDVPTEFTTFIQDDDENYMAAYSAHALSDFAVDVINPLYAYNESLQDSADGSIVQVNLFGDGSNAVHDWNAEQQNYGTLLAGDEIHIISAANISSDGKTKFNPGDFKARIYLDKTPDPESISVEYNRVTPETCNLRVWLPKLAGFDVFKSLSSKDNSSVEYITDGVSSKDYDFDFVLPKDVVSKNWTSGDQIMFMFDLRDANNSPLTVVHTPIYDYSTKKYSLDDKFPLFSLRLKTPGDLTSLDLWSFRLKDQKQQRGGVTILNNVIDAGVGEKVAIKIDNPSNGKVDVIVMTLDGNIIEYLNRGNLEGGTHYFTWNGRNRNGKAVARGMYFIRVIGNGFDETRKVMVVK